MSSTPNIKLDGTRAVAAGTQYSTSYAILREPFDARKTVSSPLAISMSVTCDTASRQVNATIKVVNTSGSAVSGTLQAALTETSIYYEWQSLDSIWHVLRGMYPSASGEAVNIPANDSVTKTRSFTLDPAWVARNCELIAFVQASSKEIVQAGKAALVPRPRVAVFNWRPDGLTRPNSAISFPVTVANTGTQALASGAGVISTTDPYVTVQTASASFGAIPAYRTQTSSTNYSVNIASGAPNRHLAWIRFEFNGADDYSSVDSFPVFIATAAGFSDDMEAGQGEWTHEGLNDQWHLSTYRSNSPTHSWYCGSDGNHQYTNENDASLMTPWFVLGTSGLVSYRRWYNTEPEYDYCVVEIGNGTSFWRQLENNAGNATSFQLASFNPTEHCGQAVRVRFRFISDPATLAEGWYVDDFFADANTGVATPQKPNAIRHALIATPRGLRYSLPAGANATLDLADASGRVVRRFDGLSGTGEIALSRDLPDGAYFARLSGAGAEAVQKLALVR